MIDTLMLEKKYYELMGYPNVSIREDADAGVRWLQAESRWPYQLPTICWSTEQATRVMLLHKINVAFYSYGVEAWHNDGGSPTTTHGGVIVCYHMDKSTRAYFSDNETFNVAVLQAAVELLERNRK